MTLEIPSNKLYDQPQTLTFENNNIFCLIGGNGSGKSSILESTFDKYIKDFDIPETNAEGDEIDNHKKIICFSSGQNELFYSIFSNYKKRSSRFVPGQNQDIKSFYFDYYWVRLLVFFALSIKRTGKVATYLNNSNYDLSTAKLHFRFRVKQQYINKVKAELEQEESGTFAVRSIRRTTHYNLLLKILQNKFDENYDFDTVDTRIVKRYISFSLEEARDVFGIEANKIFTFLTHATTGSMSNVDLESIGLYFNKQSDELEFEQLSDGEYQLLSIYALIDLFDSTETLFLFDEIDSHLHYENLYKLWEILHNISGKLITTTHIADTIISQKIDSIKNVENGRIDDDQEKTIDKVLKRLSTITSSKTHIFKISSKLSHIALVENYKDWFIFKELCKIKIPSMDDSVFQKVKYIECSSGYNTHTKKFADNKLLWYKGYKNNISGEENRVKNIFMICDKDNFLSDDINNNLTVIQTEEIKQDLRGICQKHLLSWRRREIENYLLSKTMLSHYGIDSMIENKLPRSQNLIANNQNNTNFIEDLEVKDIIQSLYCNENGTNYEKLHEVISFIPTNEISDDIVKMYNFLKEKVARNG